MIRNLSLSLYWTNSRLNSYLWFRCRRLYLSQNLFPLSVHRLFRPRPESTTGRCRRLSRYRFPKRIRNA